MSQPHFDLNTLGTNTTNVTTSPIDLIPLGTQSPESTSMTGPTDFPDQNGKSHVPGDPDPDPSLSDSSSNKYNSPNDSSSSKSIKKKINKKEHLSGTQGTGRVRLIVKQF